VVGELASVSVNAHGCELREEPSLLQPLTNAPAASWSRPGE
jgi:hypothetical protein